MHLRNLNLQIPQKPLGCEVTARLLVEQSITLCVDHRDLHEMDVSQEDAYSSQDLSLHSLGTDHQLVSSLNAAQVKTHSLLLE